MLVQKHAQITAMSPIGASFSSTSDICISGVVSPGIGIVGFTIEREIYFINHTNLSYVQCWPQEVDD